MCRRKLQAKQMRTRLVWHRYWLTESRNCSGLSDRKTGLECQAEGTVKEKLVGRLVDWLMEGWDKTGRPYHVWSSVTSSPSSYILKKKKKKKKDHREKNRPRFIRMTEVGDEDALTDMSLTVMMTICHRLLTHLTALQSGTRPGAHVHARPSAVRLGRWIAKICILAASAKLSRWGRSLLPPPLCCSPGFYISICGAPRVKRPGHGKREITRDEPWCRNGHPTPLCLLRFHFSSGHLS